MPYITYDDGDGQIKSVRLKQDGKITIGRSSGNEICLASNAKVSRAHSSIYYYADGGVYALSDLNSTNGTLLNGMKISSDVILADGDEIGVGGLKFKFHAGDEFGLTQSREIKKAEPVKAFGLADLTNLEHTQSLRIVHDTDEIKLQFGIQNELSFLEGNMIGECRIIRKLSESQMAAIFIVDAPDGSDFNEAALKIFKKPVTSDKAQEDFLYAVQEAAKVQHPGFIKYLEAGVHEGHCYYIAEYLDNLNMAKRISRKAPFLEMECLETVQSIASSLAFALSAHRVIHRNLKPSNVLFSKDGNPSIADYGLAVWESVNLAGSVSIASPWYISPEQVTGKRIGWSTDLYSLGIILFQMLTGVLPFHSTVEEELLAMHLEMPFPLPVERNPNVRVSAKTIEILKLMTDKDPSRRFSSWSEFLESVNAAIDSLCESGSTKHKPFRPDKTGVSEPTPIPPAKTNSVKRGKIVFRNKRR